MEAKIVKTIEVTRLATPPVIDAVQGDTGRVAEFVLTDMQAPNGAIGAVYAKMRRNSPVSDDEYIVYNSAEVVTTDGVTVVTVPLTSAMLAAPGIWPMGVRLQHGEDIVTSFPFELRVAPFDLDHDTIEGSNEFTALETALAALSQYDTRIRGNADAIAAETTRATSAERNIAYDLSDEIARAQQAEQDNADAIAAVKTYKAVDGTGTVNNLAGGSITQVTLTTNVPNGYHLYAICALRTSGFVGLGYATSPQNAWLYNPAASTVSGSVVVTFIFESD